jgi:hypothetical protein
LIKTFTAILTVIFLAGFHSASQAGSLPSDAVNAFAIVSDSSANIDESRNRLPGILSDAKSLMSEAIISDFHGDTLEVTFLLSRIFELMMEADQIGEMNLEDQ